MSFSVSSLFDDIDDYGDTESKDGDGKEFDRVDREATKKGTNVNCNRVSGLWKQRLSTRHIIMNMNARCALARWIDINILSNVRETDGKFWKQVSPIGTIYIVLLFWFATIAFLLLLGWTKVSGVLFVLQVVYLILWSIFPIVEPSNGPDEIVSTMVQHPFIRRVAFEGCNALFKLSRNASSSTVIKIVKSGGLEGSLSAAFVFETDQEILSRSIGTLSHLVSLKSVANPLLRLGIVDLVLHWLQISIKFESTCYSGLVLLTMVLDTPDEAIKKVAQRTAVKDGSIATTVTSVMDAHMTSARIQEWGCLLFFGLITSSVPGVVYQFYKEGVVDQIVRSLQNHQDSETIQRVGLATVMVALTRRERNPCFEKILRSLIDKKSPIFELVCKANVVFRHVDDIYGCTIQIINDCDDAYK